MEQNEIDRSSTKTDLDDGSDSFARLIVGLVVLPVLLVATYFITQIPYTVTSYRQFNDYANGKRVRFICKYKSKVGTFMHVDFEGQPILLQVTLDKNKQPPEVGNTYRVVGELGRSGTKTAGIEGDVDYVITNAEIHPANKH